MGRRHGGASVGDHYRAAARQLGKEITKPPPLPPAGAHLWDTFMELMRRRQVSSGMGTAPQPITHQDIAAWSHLKAWPLAPWEVDAVLALDDAFLASQADAP
jgi:hypothetical protein